MESHKKMLPTYALGLGILLFSFFVLVALNLYLEHITPEETLHQITKFSKPKGLNLAFFFWAGFLISGSVLVGWFGNKISCYHHRAIPVELNHLELDLPSKKLVKRNQEEVEKSIYSKFLNTFHDYSKWHYRQGLVYMEKMNMMQLMIQRSKEEEKGEVTWEALEAYLEEFAD